MTSKILAVPGSKESVRRLAGGVKAPTPTTTSTSRNSQARIAVEEEVNSIESVRKSVQNDNWYTDAHDEGR